MNSILKMIAGSGLTGLGLFFATNQLILNQIDGIPEDLLNNLGLDPFSSLLLSALVGAVSLYLRKERQNKVELSLLNDRIIDIQESHKNEITSAHINHQRQIAEKLKHFESEKDSIERDIRTRYDEILRQRRVENKEYLEKMEKLMHETINHTAEVSEQRHKDMIGVAEKMIIAQEDIKKFMAKQTAVLENIISLNK